jgi:hypothetical protein
MGRWEMSEAVFLALLHWFLAKRGIIIITQP